jgi:hypothetical protein
VGRERVPHDGGPFRGGQVRADAHGLAPKEAYLRSGPKERIHTRKKNQL